MPSTADTAEFLDLAIREFGAGSSAKVLDFGCGAGALVGSLLTYGYDAWGCDIAIPNTTHRFRKIEMSPYRLPFKDGCFDVVVSTSVLEHAKNPAEYLPELRRVLKPGGCAMHLLPGKWYLPYEPHIHVPLANWFYPCCPTWWFVLWALLGQRGPHQRGMPWRQTVRLYRDYYDTGLFYIGTGAWTKLSRSIFGNCEWPMEFYIKHAGGGFAKLARRLPFPKVWGVLSREFRMGFMLQRKT